VADLLETGLAWLGDQLKQHASRSVTYVRGTDSVVVQATPGKTEFEQADAHGLKTISETRDYLIQVADLVVAGVQILPERGDQIRDTYGETVHVFEATPVGSEPPFRFADPYRTVLRIHVREIDTEAL
jgi:hypothetical protein